MVQEATMIVVDDSDYMRNGDYHPTRAQAQAAAVKLVCQSKRLQHSENTCGLLSMAKPELLMTLTTDMKALHMKAKSVHPSDSATKNMLNRSYDCRTSLIHFVSSIRIAQLGLRHRQAKNQKMRIVVFVGSIIGEDEAALVKLGKRLKKEKVSLDIINFGEVDENISKLSTLIQTVTGSKPSSSSHLVSIPPGSSIGDSLLSSSVIMGEDGSGTVHDPSSGMDADDPDLALALRVSMEEQRQRQELEQRNQVTPTAGAEALGSAIETNTVTAEPSSEEVILQRALAMSLEPQASSEAAVESNTTAYNAGPSPQANFDSMTEDEQIAYALAMSMQEMNSTTSANKDGNVPKKVEENTMQPDAEFLEMQRLMRDFEEQKAGIEMLLDQADEEEQTNSAAVEGKKEKTDKNEGMDLD